MKKNKVNNGAKGRRKGKKKHVLYNGAPQKAVRIEGKRFVLEKLLGAGGMCEVYVALDLQRLSWSDRNPRVALKRLLPKLADSQQARLALAQEYFNLRHLSHEGIVRAYDIHEEEWGPCYTMELLEGATLYKKQGDMHYGFGRPGIEIAAKLFSSLAYLHEKGVMHADIKPANVFLAPEGRVVLFDFNVSRVEARPGRASSDISQGMREVLKIQAHSLLHASPERIATGEPSYADDIYSACCTVYECIEGAHPFHRQSSQEAQEKGMKAQKPKSISLMQWNALSRGLSFDPAKRPDADSLRSAFADTTIFTQLLTKLHVS